MPKTKKFVWEVYLRPNTLTKDNGRTYLGVHKLNNWSYVRPTNRTFRPIRASFVGYFGSGYINASLNRLLLVCPSHESGKSLIRARCSHHRKKNLPIKTQTGVLRGIP